MGKGCELSMQSASDLRNPVSYALTDFFDVLVRSMVRSGKKKREARACAYDAVELRYNISKERARAIMYAVRKTNWDKKGMRTVFIADNSTLIEFLQTANNEYHHTGPVEGA